MDNLIPLQYGTTKLVLVGDPEQLPPTVLSKVLLDVFMTSVWCNWSFDVLCSSMATECKRVSSCVKTVCKLLLNEYAACNT